MRLVDGIFNMLHQMGMWSEASATPVHESIICKGDHVSFLNAECSGVFLTDLRASTHVSQGQTIGKIVNPLTGEILSEVKSPVNGYLFTIRAYPIVYEGSLMARIYHE